GVLYVNASDVPWIAAMRDAAPIPASTSPARTGQAVYAAACANCHGGDRRGNARTPSLIGVANRSSPEQLHDVIDRGRGFMPSFANMHEDEKQAVIAYLLGRPPPVGGQSVGNSTRAAVAAPGQTRRPNSPYEFAGYERWRDSAGYPAIKPPW